ncbi:phage tail protein [Ewingella americana]|uniref:Phage tail protein n=1 Tax=Ewingella americana TaxID=41202 RepID=A0A502GI09_9GAMM|nr:phage tail protein [Ewingella americana]TPG61505.1 phage tail protein [Ewingella americana]
MSQLDELTAFITEYMPKRTFQGAGFASFMDEMKFIPAQRDLGLDQYRLAVIRYDAALTWDRFPYRLYDPRNLAALLLVWLGQVDRSLFEEMGIDDELPDFDIDVIDEETAVLAISVPMVEALNMVKDEKGNIPMDGAMWRLADPEIWLASEAHVYGVDSQGAPIGGETP